MRKLIPGMRHFVCEECGHKYSEATRDCMSPSVETCQKCYTDNQPDTYTMHEEWPTDKSGNLISNKGYSE